MPVLETSIFGVPYPCIVEASIFDMEIGSNKPQAFHCGEADKNRHFEHILRYLKDARAAFRK